jgi:hypothetical protein
VLVAAWTLEDEPCGLDQTTDGIRSKLRPGGLDGVEPGETVAYHYRFAVPESVPIFKITAELVIDKSHAWHRAKTVANCLDASKDLEKGPALT